MRPREPLGGRVHGARVGVNTDWPEEVEEGSPLKLGLYYVLIEILETRGAERPKVQHFPRSRHDLHPRSYSVHRIQEDKCERLKR